MSGAPISEQREFQAADYDLATTLSSGQAFRWSLTPEGWVGVIEGRWVCLRSAPGRITAVCAAPAGDWAWLANYLQLDADLSAILATFPNDPPLCAAVQACRGLRLLRQPLWECLASFILSSTKQIVQIRQVVAGLCRSFGQPVRVAEGFVPEFSFPSADRLAAASEAGLRACKMGFRAPYLLATAREVASGRTNLENLRSVSLKDAREELMRLPGVGRKVADCVLLFGYGFPQAFPVDVWVFKALRNLYFPRRRVLPRRLQAFVDTHFGPFAGYAQQYLFHYIRTARQPIGEPKPKRSFRPRPKQQATG
jgi:N-glycosylase/DNA lyase